eukprot:4713698-Pyramimonas_sp.AAC.1
MANGNHPENWLLPCPPPPPLPPQGARITLPGAEYVSFHRKGGGLNCFTKFTYKLQQRIPRVT